MKHNIYIILVLRACLFLHSAIIATAAGLGWQEPTQPQPALAPAVHSAIIATAAGLGQQQVMPRWPLRALLVRNVRMQMAQVTAILPQHNCRCLPPLSMLFVSSQGEGQHHSN